MNITVRSLSWDVAGRRILDQVTASFEAGQITAVVGPNGCGKTTLLHLVAGLRRPCGGDVCYATEPLARLSPRERARRVALVEQNPSTELELSARAVVELGRIPHRGRWPGSRDADATAVQEAMSLAGVAALADRRWSTMSGGERQRTHLARALAQRPRALLLDEPTNHLDLRHQIGFLATIAGLGLTTVAVLHDLDLAAAFCPRMLMLSQGRVAAAGPTAEVLTADLIARVFGVATVVEHTDRLRVLWSGLAAGAHR